MTTKTVDPIDAQDIDARTEEDHTKKGIEEHSSEKEKKRDRDMEWLEYAPLPTAPVLRGLTDLAEAKNELDQSIAVHIEQMSKESIGVHHQRVVADLLERLSSAKRLLWMDGIEEEQVRENMITAELEIQKVHFALLSFYNSWKLSNRYAWPLIIWAVIWFGVFLYLAFSPSEFIQMYTGFNVVDSTQASFYIILTLSAAWGGLGSVTFIFYDATSAITEYRFLSQYALLYLARPFTGMVLGALSYFVLATGLLAVGIPTAEMTGLGGVSLYFVFLTAWLVGFYQAEAYRFLAGLMSRFFQNEDLPTNNNRIED